MSQSHYKVNDDIYGKILKKNPSPKKIQYEEVYEAVGGLGINVLILIRNYYLLRLMFRS